MTQKRNNKQTAFSMLGDFSYIIMAVVIVGVTFTMVSSITPTKLNNTAINGEQVLGESTKREPVKYLSGGDENLPFIADFSIASNTTMSERATIKTKFTSLETVNYTFNATAIKNTNMSDVTIRITPQLSISGGYIPVSLTYAGITQTIIDANGKIAPLDLVISANSTSYIGINIQPITRIATPTTLTLDFIEVD